MRMRAGGAVTRRPGRAGPGDGAAAGEAPAGTGAPGGLPAAPGGARRGRAPVREAGPAGGAGLRSGPRLPPGRSATGLCFGMLGRPTGSEMRGLGCAVRPGGAGAGVAEATLARRLGRTVAVLTAVHSASKSWVNVKHVVISHASCVLDCSELSSVHMNCL